MPIAAKSRAGRNIEDVLANLLVSCGEGTELTRQLLTSHPLSCREGNQFLRQLTEAQQKETSTSIGRVADVRGVTELLQRAYALCLKGRRAEGWVA